MRFNGKCAIVTGGASGIGRAACLAFAREGAAIAVADMNLDGAEATAREVRAFSRKAVAIAVNVADPASVAQMVELAVSELGHLDILNNCAGVRELIPFLELKFDDWQRIISINLTGSFLCSQLSRDTWLALNVPAKSSTCHLRRAWSPPPIARHMSLPSTALSA